MVPTDADQALLARAAEWRRAHATELLTAATIRRFTDEHGMDFATAVLFEQVAHEPRNAALRVAAASAVTNPPARIRVGIVPGAFYREHAHTGADGARIAAILARAGVTAEVIPVHSFGSLAENAAIILAWLRSAGAEPVVLLSLSKGACDVKTALATGGPAAFARVRAWISLSGLSTGTPLVGWLRARPWRWAGVWFLLALRGQRIRVLEELRDGPESPLARWPAWPATMTVVHVHGFPLRRHLLHPWAARAYERLAPLGPNDGGGILLAEVARWPGLVYPVFGADHYLQPARDLAGELGRVFQAVLRMSVAG